MRSGACKRKSCNWAIGHLTALIRPRGGKHFAMRLRRPGQPGWIAGCGVRRLVVLPSAETSADANMQIEQLSGGPCTVLGDANEAPLMLVEAEQIPLRSVVATLAEGRTEIAQLAERLHTRTDISWSQLF